MDWIPLLQKPVKLWAGKYRTPPCPIEFARIVRKENPVCIADPCLDCPVKEAAEK